MRLGTWIQHPVSARRRARHFLPSSLLLAVFAGGCIPAPGPSTPPQGDLEIGADYRPSAINRWVCPSDGSVVLARRGPRVVLHLENKDWVLSGAEKGDLAKFAYSTFGGEVSVGWVTTKLNQGETVFVASKQPSGDLIVKRADQKGVTEEKCTWVES